MKITLSRDDGTVVDRFDSCSLGDLSKPLPRAALADRIAAAQRTCVYYTLVTRNDSGEWTTEFGDYDPEVVEDERRDLRVPSKIIKTSDRQADIEAAIHELNTKP